MTDTTLSTKEVAALLNVTETTIKRWAGEGKIPCVKTLGGHRKFSMNEIIQFAEKNSYPITGTIPPPVTDEQLDQLEFGVHTRNYRKLSEIFFQESLQGDSQAVFQLLLYLYKHHINFALIADEIIKPALVRIGEYWARGEIEISHEHRASQAITAAMIRLAPELYRKPLNGLSAMCACIEGEIHEIGLRSLAFTLESEGWKVDYIGANTPVDTMISFIKRVRPEAVCVSFTVMENEKKVLEGFKSVGSLIKSYGGRFIVGGFYSVNYTASDLYCDHIASSAHDALDYLKDEFKLKPGPKKDIKGVQND